MKKFSCCVRPGVCEVRAKALRLVSALIRLDFPTLERPASAISTPLLVARDALGGQENVVALVKGMSGVVAATTVYSGLSYAWLKDAVTILGNDEALKKKQGFRGRMIIALTFGSVVLLAAALWWRDLEKQRALEEANKG